MPTPSASTRARGRRTRRELGAVSEAVSSVEPARAREWPSAWCGESNGLPFGEKLEASWFPVGCCTAELEPSGTRGAPVAHPAHWSSLAWRRRNRKYLHPSRLTLQGIPLTLQFAARGIPRRSRAGD